MYEMFEFEGGSSADGGDFVQSEFAGEHGPGKAHLLQLVDAGAVVDGHLGGGMQGQAGEKAADQSPEAGILNDQCIDADIREARQDVEDSRQFGFLNQRVAGQIEPAALLVRIDGHLRDFGQCEIFGLGPGREFGKAAIDSVGASVERGDKGLDAAGRGK